MRKLFKRAFTLVELLVVIAILGVLATVSIVGYSSYTKRANLQADSTLVSEWNHLLLAEDNINEIDNVNEAKELFISHSTNEDTFVPKSNNYHFYYNTTYNNVFLVDDINGFTVSYPTDNTITAANSYRLDLEYCLVETTIAGVNLNKNALVINQSNEVTLSGDTIPNSIKLGDKFLKVTNDKVSITPTSSTSLTIEQDTNVYISSISFDPTSVNVTYQENITLNPVYDESEYTAGKNTITWTSNNEEVATVDSTGKVTGVKVGTATITVSAKNIIDTYYGVCTVNVISVKVDVPTANAGLVYNGTVQTGVTLNSVLYNLTGNTGTDAVNYHATAILEDKVNYQWNLTTPTADNQIIDWSIAKKDVTITASAQTIKYGGNIATADTNKVSADSLVSGHTISAVTLSTTDTDVTNNGTITPSSATITSGGTDVTSNYNITYATGTLTINAKELNEEMVSGIENKTYTGNQIEQTVTVKDGDTTLAIGTDYTVAYSNNINAGTATVTITGTGNYTDVVSKNFTINKAVKTAPANAPMVEASLNVNQINFTVSGITGDNIQYACVTSGTAPAVDSNEWVNSTTFNEKNTGTTYYFFARYAAGDTNHEPSNASSVTEIKLYSITIGTIENGLASVDKVLAKQGDTVIITVTPNEGYVIDKVEGTNDITLTKQTDGTYKFTMPEGNVTITVTFKHYA